MPLHGCVRISVKCQTNDVTDYVDLIGTDPEDYQMSGLGLSAGLKGMMRTAVEKANIKYEPNAHSLPLHADVQCSILF